MQDLPLARPRVYGFWSINDRLDAGRLAAQIDRFAGAGYDGVVFQPRDFPNRPPYLGPRWMAEVSRCIHRARQAGMDFWIQDENGFPTGTAGGRLLKRFPEAVGSWLELVADGEAPRPEAGWLLSFRVRGGRLSPLREPGELFHLRRIRGNSLDFLSADACRRFIDAVYEPYRTGLDERALEALGGFFTDEPQMAPHGGGGHARGSVPWSRDLPRRFKTAHGEDLLPLIPLLWFDGDGAADVRWRFRECVAQMMCEAFFQPVNAWCDACGLTFTGHVKGEETPVFQVPFVGSATPVFERMRLPGIDALERFPGNPFFPRLVSSVARQFGNGQCLAECFGGSGWGADPGDLLTVLLWLADHGLTHFVLHQQQYTLDAASLTDWPPSLPFDVSWREAIPQLLARFRQEGAERLAARGEEAVLLVVPQRRVMSQYEPWEIVRTNVHDGGHPPDTAAGRTSAAFMARVERCHRRGLNYELAEERLIEERGEVSGDCLVLGQRRYRSVRGLSAGLWSARGQTLLAQWRSSGRLANGVRDERLRGGGSQVTLSPSDGEPVQRSVETPQSGWAFPDRIRNRFPLEFVRLRRNLWRTEFESQVAPETTCVLFSRLVAARLNGVALTLQNLDAGTCARLSSGVLARSNSLEIEPRPGYNAARFRDLKAAGVPVMWGFLEGGFRVISKRRFHRLADGGVCATDGPFVLVEAGEPDAADLTASGWPFCMEGVRLGKTVQLPPGRNRTLQLCEVRASCAHVVLGRANRGWCWAPEWRVPVPDAVPAGPTCLEVRLVPSAFSFFGPHHHMDGDRPLVSPAQFVYRRNFADDPRAPASTFVPRWAVRAFGIGESVRVRAGAP